MKRLIGISALCVALSCVVCSFSVEKPVRAQQMFQSFNYPTGLVGWWKLCGDTTATSGCVPSSSTTVYDSSSYGNSGTWNGTQAGSNYWYSAGEVGPYAGYFDGSTDYVADNSAATVVQTGSISFTAWIYLPSTYNSSSNGQFIVDCDDGPGNNPIQLTMGKYTGSFTKDGMLHMGVYNGSAYVNNTGSQSSWSSGWYFVAGTYSSTNGLKAYINGSLDGSAVAATRGGTPYSTHFAIGRAASASVGLFTGRITDVRVYNRELSAGEIAMMYLAHN